MRNTELAQTVGEGDGAERVNGRSRIAMHEPRNGGMRGGGDCAEVVEVDTIGLLLDMPIVVLMHPDQGGEGFAAEIGAAAGVGDAVLEGVLREGLCADWDGEGG